MEYFATANRTHREASMKHETQMLNVSKTCKDTVTHCGLFDGGGGGKDNAGLHYIRGPRID